MMNKVNISQLIRTLNLSQRLLVVIVVLYLVLATIYSVVTPIFEASDELWHYPMVDYLARSGLQLPVQNASNTEQWRQEGSQPPLYYMFSALIIAGIDRSDFDVVRRQNPHADIGVIVPDGNANMMMHQPERENFPWQKSVLAVHVVRFFSIALGLGTILVTYLIVREIFPEYPLIAVGATALNAFLPMFLFISASVNNDNLSNLLGNLLTLLTVRLLKTASIPTWCSYLIVGVVIGCGLLAKLNIGFWIPVLILALIINSIRFKSVHPIVVGGSISGTITILIAGWWYWRNWQLYGDPTGLNVFLDIVGRRAIPANAIQLWSERSSFTQSFWGFFGGMNVSMTDLIYSFLNAIGFVGILSALIFIVYHFVKRSFTLKRWAIIAVPVIWPLVTFASYLRWTAETPASQGRLIFGALSSICLWIVVGWTWWFPKPIRLLPIIIAVSILLMVAIVVPFVFIAPAYAFPDPIQLDNVTPIALFSEPQSDGKVGLYQAQLITQMAQPENFVKVQITWGINKQTQRDWSLFAHLVSPNGVIIGQRDVYPGQGRLVTSNLSPKHGWENSLAIWIPAAAYAPMSLDVQIGWYDLVTGERMILPNGATTFSVGQVDLQPRSDDLDIPNPIRINFDNQIELIGYKLSTLTPQAGETIELTLFWRRLRAIQEDFTIFAHVLNPTNLTIYGESNSQPSSGNTPTTSWRDGEIIIDTHQLQVANDTPAGIYELEIGLYLQKPDGGFPRLRVVTPDGGMANDFAFLTRLKALSSGISN